MQCKFCGAELPAGAYKCDMCGQNIHSKKTPMEGGMFGDVLMTAPTEYKSIPIKEPSKLPKIIGISAAALVVVVGIIIALVIFLITAVQLVAFHVISERILSKKLNLE